MLVLFFIGITGVIFVLQKYHEGSESKVNFLSISSKEEVDFKEKESEEDFEKEKQLKENEVEKSEKIFVHVCGEVKKEGVYELSEGSRVVDAIRLAGGLTKKANKRGVNQAELIQDGAQIYIPSKEEGMESENSSKSSSGKINLNSASKEELMTLPGIGEKKAIDIIKYRSENGGFKDISEIKNIRGIKENLFNKIKDKITV